MVHSKSPGFESGKHWAVCDRCGFDFRAHELKEDKQKPGLWVCSACWDGKHPQEFVRAVKEKMTPDKPVRPPPTDVFAETDFDTQQVTIPSPTFNTNTL